MGDIHLTGDLHFGHFNKFGGILAYANRPFPNIKIHDGCLIDNWNSQVKVGDVVIIDGDLSFASVKRTKEILGKLNGKKIMVTGDHDKQVWQCREFFEEITPYKTITIGKHFIVVTHWAYRVWRASHYNSYMAFAHSHGRLPPIGKSFDIGVDTECDFEDVKHERFFPYHIDEFLKIMEHRPDNVNYIKNKSKDKKG